MIQLDVAFFPGELEAKSFHGSPVVVVDVVRATTTIITALAQGCAFVLPVLHVEEAFEAAHRYAGPIPLLLGGERGGKRVEGFDLGNSPREYTAAVVDQKGLIFSTTNGTRTLLALDGAFPIVIGAFVNMSAVCQYLLRYVQEHPTHTSVLVACSGVMNSFSLEDTVCAGMFVRQISTQAEGICKTPAATAAEILYAHYQGDLLDMLRNSDGGRRVAHIGLARDLVACAEVDAYPLVPLFHEGKITP
jgi:2-phosphosulfolactate phosphatase